MQTSACVRHSRTHLLIYIESRRWITGYPVVFGVPTTIQRERAVALFLYATDEIIYNMILKTKPCQKQMSDIVGRWKYKCQATGATENVIARPHGSLVTQMPDEMSQ